MRNTTNTILNKLKFFALTSSLVFAFGCGEKDSDEDSDSSSSDDTTSESGTVSGSSTAADAPKNSTLSLDIQGTKPGLSLLATPTDVIGSDGTVVGSLSITSAQLILDKIRFKMESEESEESDEVADEEDDEEDEEEDTFKGPYLVDLLTNTVTPSIKDMKVPAGVYKQLELNVHKVDEEELAALGLDESSPMAGKSIYVTGSYTPTGGTSVAFTMSYELSERFILAGNAGMDVTSGANAVVIAFRLASWFDFSNLETNSDEINFTDIVEGDITLDKDSEDAAKDIQEVIKENIKESADFGKDSDGDGELAEDEDSEDDDEEEEDDDSE
jgi:hypothetical protein